MVKDRRSDGPIPTEAINVGVADSVVIVDLQTRKVGRSESSWHDARPVTSVVEGDPAAVGEVVIALEAELGVGANFAAGTDQVIIVDVTDRAGGRAVVRFQRASSAKSFEGLNDLGIV